MDFANFFPGFAKKRKIADPEEVAKWDALLSQLQDPSFDFEETLGKITTESESSSASIHFTSQISEIARNNPNLPHHFRLIEWLCGRGDTPGPIFANWNGSFASFSLESKATFLLLLRAHDKKTPEALEFVYGLVTTSNPDVPDKLRSLAAFSLGAMMPNDDRPAEKDRVMSVLRELASTRVGEPIAPDAPVVLGPLTKFAATFTFLKYCEPEDEPIGILSFLELMENWQQLSLSWQQQMPSLKAPWAAWSGPMFNLLGFLSKTAGNSFPFITNTVGILSGLSEEHLTTHLYPALEKNFERKLYASSMFLVQCRLAPLHPAAYFSELEPLAQSILNLLVKDPDVYVEGSNTFLEGYVVQQLNLPSTHEKLQALISTPLPAELASKKRVPNFAGLDQVPWNTLGHAYGTAGDMPSLIRTVASTNAEERKGAFQNLYAAPFHQGTVYSCTPFVAQWLIKLLEFELQEDKSQILSWLAHAAVSWPEGYSYERFNEETNLPKSGESGNDPEYHFGPSAVLDTYKAVLSGVDVMLELLRSSADTDARVHACYCLQLFPRRKADILNVAFELLELPELPTLVQCALWVLVTGFVTTNDEVSGRVIEKVEALWRSPDSAQELKHVATYSHARMLKDSIEPLPADLKSALLDSSHVPASFKGDGWPWGGLIHNVLQARKNEFIDDFVSQLKTSTTAEAAENMAMSLITTCFEAPNGGHSGGKVPDWYDFRACFWTEAQKKALDAIVSCDLCWVGAKTTQELEQIRTSSGGLGFFKHDTGAMIQHRLQHYLYVGAPVTREQLKISLQKLEELPAISKDDLASGAVQLNRYNNARFFDQQ